MEIRKDISNGLTTGFVDSNFSSLEKYHPKLLVNDYKREVKVLSSIIHELRSCEEFYFSVAFITKSGVISLIETLKLLREKKIKGKILTSQYQNFTQPDALKMLLGFENIELKIATDGNFHAKGYIFKKREDFSFIIGSSNLTQSALSENNEWNLKLSSLENGLIIKNIIKEFEYNFDNSTKVTSAWIEAYERVYGNQRKIQEQASVLFDNVINFNVINPNKMQIEALEAIRILRSDGKNKALIVSATGTGKTYLSAFDVKAFKAKRFLFVVHRENIAKAAMESYKQILGNEIDAGLLTGNHRNFDCKYTFATIQTLSKDNCLQQFKADDFDYLLIDEAHRSGAESYKKILTYFTPEFLLGMTATPERTDAYDIFKAFDNNIAYEIRLNKALEEKMLSPFHYFGITEIEVNGTILDDKADFSKLTCEARIDHIIRQAQVYGCDDGKLKGLIFCSRVDEAKKLAEGFNSKGYRTLALDGASTENDREKAILRLEKDTGDNALDYIFSVDIFNEGVDIPSVNQIIMLRPTQSAIIFVQQLGRGLRKIKGKEYLTVLNFIGNYSNNYLVPIALYGDRSYNKDNIRKLLNSGSSVIPGCSTINFDEITNTKIYNAIDSTNLSLLKNLKNDYNLLKYQLGRIPMMMDFVEHGGREPYSFIISQGSYYNFINMVEPNLKYKLDKEEEIMLNFYSKEVLNGKRIEEGILLALLIAKGITSFSEICQITMKNFNYEPTYKTIESTISLINGQFFNDADKKKYGLKVNITIEKSNPENKKEFIICIDARYREQLAKETMHFYLNDMIKYSMKSFETNYNNDKYRNGFLLYKKYSRKDACRILNWDKDESATIYGYRIKHNTCPIFVTYHKEEDISDSTKYEDSFINSKTFSWMTRNNVTMQSKEMHQLKEQYETGLRIPLFVKKSNGEGTDFYYMGDLDYKGSIQKTIKNDKGKELPIVNIVFNLQDEVEESIYQYFEG